MPSSVGYEGFSNIPSFHMIARCTLTSIHSGSVHDRWISIHCFSCLRSLLNIGRCFAHRSGASTFNHITLVCQEAPVLILEHLGSLLLCFSRTAHQSLFLAFRFFQLPGTFRFIVSFQVLPRSMLQYYHQRCILPL